MDSAAVLGTAPLASPGSVILPIRPAALLLRSLVLRRRRATTLNFENPSSTCAAAGGTGRSADSSTTSSASVGRAQVIRTTGSLPASGQKAEDDGERSRRSSCTGFAVGSCVEYWSDRFGWVTGQVLGYGYGPDGKFYDLTCRARADPARIRQSFTK